MTEVLRPPDSLTDYGVVLVLRVQTAQGALTGVCHREKTLSEPFDPVAVVNLSQVPPDDLPGGEGVQELVPQQDVLGAQLGDVAVGFQQEILLRLQGVRHLYQFLHSPPAVHDPHIGSLKVRDEP